MQIPESEEISLKAREFPHNSEEQTSPNSFPVKNDDEDCDDASDDLVLDVSGKRLEFSVSEKEEEDNLQGLYLYKNVYSLIPNSLGGFGRLRTLKFFGNEINLLPSESKDLTGLECLQMRISSPVFGGLPLHELKSLKELELSKVPPRPSSFPILSEIAALKCLIKLSVCHFSIRYLPPEIGCLKKLKYLDLSFNKIKSLPPELSHLHALKSVKVANNKLMELSSDLSSLPRLENLDLSNNRLTSLGSLELHSMTNLRNLNLQYNKLPCSLQVPSWICCNLEGNKNTYNDDFSSSSVEMDLYETTEKENDRSISHTASHNTSSNQLVASSSNNRCFATRKSGKRWKRRCYFQQKARQERLNNSRKWKSVDHAEFLSKEMQRACEQNSLDIHDSETFSKTSSGILDLNDNVSKVLSGEEDEDNETNNANGAVCIKRQFPVEDSSFKSPDSSAESKVEPDASLPSSESKRGKQDERSCSEGSTCSSKSKRHSDGDLDNPKPLKSRKPIGDSSKVSCTYSDISFCSIEDHLPDGFYDAGRDRPFLPLESYEQSHCLDSREVILLDRESDEQLDVIIFTAKALVSNLKQLDGLTRDGNQAVVDDWQRASFLALFVSDHFGGSDRSSLLDRTRKTVSGSNYQKPFICTCSTGSRDFIDASSIKPSIDTVEDFVLSDICERSLRSIKARRNSLVVPIGTLQYGVCRHRALLLKYLCDHMEPPLPCELIRGYLDFLPHAWNTITIKRGDTWVRMLVDACRPHDIREETDPEYLCRYIPLSRTIVPLSDGGRLGPGCSFPSLSSCHEIEKAGSSTLVRCKLGSIEAVAKVRTLKVRGDSVNDIRNFEYNCLGEVRILGALKHSSIVEMYGHRISSKWVLSEDGTPEYRILESSIYMEYVDGGSLKSYLEKLSKCGKKLVPLDLALYIAKVVASALAEMHSKHIIHRDIKSENVLIDLDLKRDNGTPIVKLCDFDRAVPLRSLIHSCCIAHMGIPPPNVCVGTPRWMAPEVMRAMYEQNKYGLEADIWSFGCLILELLTLQVPYSELSDDHIHDLLQMDGKRPQLPHELDALVLPNDPPMASSDEEVETSNEKVEKLKFLIDLFNQCTEENPADRPTAKDIYNMVLTHTGCMSSS